MPTIYLSPSSQEFNTTILGPSEEYYMNLIADAMEPYLDSSGIRYTRNNPNNTASGHIAESNAGQYDLHLALHSNAAAGANAGRVRGSEVYYYPYSANGQRAAEIIARNLQEIYPLPNQVRTIPTTSLGEVARTRAPAVLIEFAFHDNYEDATWIAENIEAIARNVVLSLTEYFGIPFVEPQVDQAGMVQVDGPVYLYSMPSTTSQVVATLFRGDQVTVVGTWHSWYVVHYGNAVGYIQQEYITLI